MLSRYVQHLMGVSALMYAHLIFWGAPFWVTKYAIYILGFFVLLEWWSGCSDIAQTFWRNDQYSAQKNTLLRTQQWTFLGINLFVILGVMAMIFTTNYLQSFAFVTILALIAYVQQAALYIAGSTLKGVTAWPHFLPYDTTPGRIVSLCALMPLVIGCGYVMALLKPNVALPTLFAYVFSAGGCIFFAIVSHIGNLLVVKAKAVCHMDEQRSIAPGCGKLLEIFGGWMAANLLLGAVLLVIYFCVVR